MPEIKHQFTGGKMEKDLDERLIPNGQYRDAMNVQVSTSENSDVGTVQNVLGNKIIEGQSIISDESVVVATIADEKDDALYWFVAGKRTPKTTNRQAVTSKDMIIQLKNNVITPVLVDVFETILTFFNVGTGVVNFNTSSTGPNPRWVEWPSTALPNGGNLNIEVGMYCNCYNNFSQQGVFGRNRVVDVEQNSNGDVRIYFEKEINVLDNILSQTPASHKSTFFSFSTEPLPVGFNVDDPESSFVLNFAPNNLITGINIIDDMLFWTDNRSEPKKINIPRCIAGTDPSGEVHTRLINEKRGIQLGGSSLFPNEQRITEAHLTVIRPAPKKAPILELNSGRDVLKSYAAVMHIGADENDPSSFLGFSAPTSANGHVDFSTVQIGDLVAIRFLEDHRGNTGSGNGGNDYKLEWKVNDVVVFQEFNEDGDEPGTPISDFTMRGYIVEHPYNRFDSSIIGYAQAVIRITNKPKVPKTSATGTTTGFGQLKYMVDKFDEEKDIFEFKFPRFGYRYKYLDGEYSTFSPFSQPAFLPGAFDFHAKKGFNLGMVNDLKSVIVKDFANPQETPLDVIEIDILYKEDSSPNVYVVETISPNTIMSADGLVYSENDKWGKNEYEITSETITSILPSNQLLRPWDNVPKFALAQEVIGNRIVYANYVQNFDLKDENGNRFLPDLTISLDRFEDSKSIKSLREYQLGVTFTDKYGRETPVITSETGTNTIGKEFGSRSNRFRVKVKNKPSFDAKYFKFYIKETSGEFYNLAMDRFYEASDGNYWLSFPSADRNKLDIDTFLILKKSQDSDVIVSERARYKILAISNEAPDFIKTEKLKISSLKHIASEEANEIFGSIDNSPRRGISEFKLKNLQDTTADGLFEFLTVPDVELYIEFEFQEKRTERYRVLNIKEESGSNIFNVSIEKKFGDEINYILDDDTGDNPSKVKQNTIVNFYKYEVRNKPEFDGKFFVKIFSDTVFQTKIIAPTVEEEKEYRVIQQRKIYFGPSKDKLKSILNGSNEYDANCKINANNDGGNGNEPEFDFDGSTPSLDNGGFDGGNDGGLWEYYQAWFTGLNTGAISYIDDRGYYGDSLGWWQSTRYSDYFNYHEHFGGGYLWGQPSKGRAGVFTPVYFVDNMYKAGGVGHEQYPQGVRKYNDHGGTQEFTNDHQYMKKNGTNSGLTHFNDSTRIMLGIGPILFNSRDGSVLFWDPYRGEKKSNLKYFYSLDADKNPYMQSFHGDFITSLDEGNTFRFREDPTNTIYSVVRRVRTKHNYWNFNDDPHEEVSTPAAQTFYKPYNFRKAYEIWVEPPMTGWNPFGGDSIGGGQGDAKVIDESRVINKYVTDVSTTPLTTANLTILGPLDTQYSDGAQAHIDISEEMFENSFDSKYEEFAGITPGMIITEINGSDQFNSDNKPVLIKRITKGSGNSNRRLHLIGYNGTKVKLTAVAGHTIKIQQPTCNGLSPNAAHNIRLNSKFDDYDVNQHYAGIGSVGYTLEVIEETDREAVLPDDPAIFETEPKETADLDIYYEASNYNPIELDESTISLALPINSIITLRNDDSGNATIENETIISSYEIPGGATIATPNNGDIIQLNKDTSGINPNQNVSFNVIKPNGEIIEIKIIGKINERTFRINKDLYNNEYYLNWHNCYSFENGLESNRIRDNFNLPFIANGVKASTTLPEEKYLEERRKYGLIYSGLYNSITGVNNLNQFIQAEKITKEVNPIYGSIQKLHSRDSDLVTLCEDKVLKILANKDALFNADGNTNLTATENVLGQAVPFIGEYGISTNPESFASEAYRAYFTDKVRGKVLRLSRDGLTPISDAGMKDWFRDNLKLGEKIVGSFDDRQDDYNVAIKNQDKNNQHVITFSESVKGWVSFKSFVDMEHAMSMANNYYTFKNGKVWQHHVEGSDNNLNPRNTFYGNITSSSINVILNDAPGSIKNFQTLNYEGSQSRVRVNLEDDQYYNLIDKDGWWVDKITTDQQTGSVNEFIEKELKWFNYIKGTNKAEGTIPEFDEFSSQGIGFTTSSRVTSSTDTSAGDSSTSTTGTSTTSDNETGAGDTGTDDIGTDNTGTSTSGSTGGTSSGDPRY